MRGGLSFWRHPCPCCLVLGNPGDREPLMDLEPSGPSLPAAPKARLPSTTLVLQFSGLSHALGRFRRVGLGPSDQGWVIPGAIKPCNTAWLCTSSVSHRLEPVNPATEFKISHCRHPVVGGRLYYVYIKKILESQSTSGITGWPIM